MRRSLPLFVLMVCAATFLPSGTVRAERCENPSPLPISLQTYPPCPQPADTVWLMATSPCAACLDLQSIRYETGAGWVVTSTSGPLEKCQSVPCSQPDFIREPLGQFPAGHHRIVVNEHNLVTDSTGAQCNILEQHVVEFDVGLDCWPPDSVQYLDHIVIGTPPCDTCPPRACANQPTPVFLSGVIGASCYRFRRVELLPVTPTVIGPPTVRIVFGEVDCVVTPCLPDSIPWQASVSLPPLPPGGYRLRVESAIVLNCGNDSSVTVTGAELYRYQTLDCGQPPPPSCLWASWQRAADDSSCDASVAADRPAHLTMTMRATEPVAGFQGKLSLSPLGLEVTSIRPVGVAEGMRLAWNRLPDGGASFVLFSESGQLLPPCNPLVDCAACCLPSPVLDVTVAARDPVRFPPVTQVLVWELLGADSLGNAIYACVRTPEDREKMIARICADKPCDANDDGFTDVRDLVRMVRCLTDPAACGFDSAGTSLDCQNDGDFDLADVICCARVLLRGQVPDSSKRVHAPNVYVRFGDPIRTDDGLDVPIIVNQGWQLSAARLGVDLPLDLFDVAGLSVNVRPQDWLALHEVAEGTVSLGFVRIAPPSYPGNPTDPLTATLHLALKPGAAAAGQLWLSDGDFSGGLGEMLIPGESQHSVSLGSGSLVSPLSLAPPRPNPMIGEVTLSLSLDREADVDVAVHDLVGRRVSTIHRGKLAAGPHTFTWAGRTDEGSAAPSGVYFVRARVGDRLLTRKLALLGGR